MTEELVDEGIKIARSILAEKCKDSFFLFLKEFWGEVVSEDMVYNWHIEYLCRRLQELFEKIEKGIPPGDLAVNVPPGTSKTSICTVIFPAWMWVRRAKTRILSGSYSKDIALDSSVKSRDLLKSDKFQSFYPGLIDFKSDMDNKGYYANTKKGNRISSSVGGAATGRHADIILIDDPMDPRMADSELERKTANAWLEKTLSSRKTNKEVTPTILIMQRLHEDDPTGRLLAREPDTPWICLPAEITELDNVNPPELKRFYVDGLLDPKRLNEKVLAKARKIHGKVDYGGQFLQSPKDAEGNIFKREWFKTYTELPHEKPLWKIQSWDTAYKKGQENDFSVCTDWIEFESGIYLVGFFMGKLEYPELKQEIQLRAKSFKPHEILIEDKASGQSAIQELKRLFLPIKPIVPDGDKILRANQSTPPFESGNVYFPVEEFTEKIISQMTGFPNTKHDDIVDSVTQLINYIRDHGSGELEVFASNSRESRRMLRGYDA